MNDIEDALQRLDKLEQGELRTVIAQVAKEASALNGGACLLHPTLKLTLTIFGSGLKRIEAVMTAHDCSYFRGTIAYKSSPSFL